MKKSYTLRVVIAVDQLFNVLLMNGSEDHTISGHVGWKAYTTDKKYWKVLERFINGLIWFDKDHCYKSIEWDEVEYNVRNRG